MSIKGYVPFLILLYILHISINGYIPFLVVFYILPININGSVPFLINTLDTIVVGADMVIKSYTTSSGLLSSRRWQVL